MERRRAPNLNPELESIRNDTILLVKPNHDLLTENLIDLSKNLHAAYLFHPQGWKALKAICMVMSSTTPSTYNDSWRDLAAPLGLSFHQMGCVENYKIADCTETVLKTYAQKPDATIEKLVQILHELKRHDVLAKLKPHLQELKLVAEKEHAAKVPEDINSGYSLLPNSGYHTMKIASILKPEGQHRLCHQLPITLKELMVANKSIRRPIIAIESDSIQTSSPIRRPKRKACSRRVMMTFAEDGEKIARDIAKNFRTPRGDNLPIGVLILDEQLDKVTCNPEQFITTNFPRMDYIVPILTEGYLELLKETPPVDSYMTCFDPRYVQFIHDLMSKYYVENCCRNYKIRCVIPDNQLLAIRSHPHVRVDPVFNVFFKLSEIDELAQWILKYKPKRMVDGRPV